MQSEEWQSEFVSVVIPVFNQERYIASAIQSVVDQDYPNKEVIVVDNFSTDGTATQVQSFCNDYSFVRHCQISNFGIVAASRNHGIKVARGEWIAFLDSDDFWLPGKLSSVIEFICNNPTVDLVCHDMKVVDTLNGAAERIRRLGPHTEFKELLLAGNCLSASGTVMRRKVAIAAGMFPEFRGFVTAEDYAFWLEVSRNGKIAYFHEVYGVYRKHGLNLSGNLSVRTQNLVNVLRYYGTEFEKSGDRIACKKLARKIISIWDLASLRALRTFDFELALFFLQRACDLDSSILRAYLRRGFCKGLYLLGKLLKVRPK